MSTPENPNPSGEEQKPGFIHSIEGLTEADYFNRMSSVEDPDSFVQSCLNEFFFEPLRPGFQLEIGFGQEPFNREKSYALPFHDYSAESQYVGIDGGASEYVGDNMPGWMEYSDSIRQGRFRASVRRAEEDRESRRNDSEFIHFLAGDAKDLPFKDGSVQTVYLKDVLLAANVVESDIYRIFAECQRVMKPGGLMTIIESQTRPYGPDYRQGDEDDGNYIILGKALEAAGFSERATADQFIFARKTTGNET